jgi:hypothetical protein
MTKVQKSFQLQPPRLRGKKRYLCGIATGLKQDGHGERMSGNCIRSIIRQSREKDILLFPDEHGIRESEDIGILHNLKRLPNGDVYVEFRLYDDTDGVDAKSVGVANKLWAQANGFPPYTKPREKGFSIEGYIPEDREDLEDKRDEEGIIDDMKVEGFVVVPEPAYEDSVIRTVEKSKKIMKEKKMAKKVKKALTPEEEDIVSQIEEQIMRLREIAKGETAADKLIEEAKDGEEIPAGDEDFDEVNEDDEYFENDRAAEESESNEPEEDELEEEEVVKRKVKKSETGRASAEEKVNTLDPDDDRALQVLKSLFTRVEKSKGVPDATIKYFHETHRVMKSLFARIEKQQRRIHDLENSVSGMLEGVGITEEVLASPKHKVAKSRLSPDAQAIVEAFGNVIQKSQHSQENGRVQNFGAGNGDSLGDILYKLFD